MRRTLQGLKNKGTLAKWRTEQGHRRVLIWSGEWQSYWRANGCGYTPDPAQSGVYTLDEAIKFSGHCSHEKKITYIFLPEPKPGESQP